MSEIRATFQPMDGNGNKSVLSSYSLDPILENDQPINRSIDRSIHSSVRPTHTHTSPQKNKWSSAMSRVTQCRRRCIPPIHGPIHLLPSKLRAFLLSAYPVGMRSRTGIHWMLLPNPRSSTSRRVSERGRDGEIQLAGEERCIPRAINSHDDELAVSDCLSWM